jgi:hypothetical protein
MPKKDLNSGQTPQEGHFNLNALPITSATLRYRMM